MATGSRATGKIYTGEKNQRVCNTCVYRAIRYVINETYCAYIFVGYIITSVRSVVLHISSRVSSNAIGMRQSRLRGAQLSIFLIFCTRFCTKREKRESTRAINQFREEFYSNVKTNHILSLSLVQDILN